VRESRTPGSVWGVSRNGYSYRNKLTNIRAELQMRTSWHFIAVRAATPSGFTWHWQKQGPKVPVTSAPFAFYFDCVCDARDKGYSGPLPPGPRTPIEQLPNGLDSARVPQSQNPDSAVMTLTPVSASEKKRRSCGRSGVA